MPTETVQTGICRFDIEEHGTHGYMMRIHRAGRGYCEFFSDRKYGGKRKAKAAAVAERRRLEQELPDPATSKNRKLRRNSSGKVGVHLAHDVDKRLENCEYWSYVASWLSPDRKRINVKFSWKRYGEEAAWAMACIARDNEIRDREEVVRLYEKGQAWRRRKAVSESPEIIRVRKTRIREAERRQSEIRRERRRLKQEAQQAESAPVVRKIAVKKSAVGRPSAKKRAARKTEPVRSKKAALTRTKVRPVRKKK
ncbi:MAG: hypothetical protein R3C49_00900 [Planctomycetaceae bacterium]